MAAGHADRCKTSSVAVDFEAFVLIGNIIQSKTAAVFSAALPARARSTAAMCHPVSKWVQDQTSLDYVNVVFLLSADVQ